MRMIRKKKRAERRIVAEGGLPQMGPGHYLDYLPILHQDVKPEVYFEIGTESGASMTFADCEVIAVDPTFQIDPAAYIGRRIIHLYQMPSDDFFAADALARLADRVDLAFLDGMHLFEYLLRDFINIEKHMNPDGAVAMHDCVPFSFQAAEREWDRSKTASWTGDVWKIIPILKEYRPDLDVSTYSLAPSGLVVVRGLDPRNTVLTDRYNEILARYIEVSLSDYGVETFTNELGLTDPFAQSKEKKNLAEPAT